MAMVLKLPPRSMDEIDIGNTTFGFF